MSKYITHFQTEAAYQAALQSLDLPNVSLVDELGEVHYHRALYGAHAGDICLYDVAEAQKIVVTAENWNLTTYPTASYPIIGVVVAETPLGCTVVSTMIMASDGSQTTNEVLYKWLNDNFYWSNVPTWDDVTAALGDLNGKANTAAIIAAIKAYDLEHSTDNITGNICDAIQKYAPTGTIAGDWYIPAAGELKILSENLTSIRTTFNKIHTASSSLCMADNSLFPNDINTSSYIPSSYTCRVYKDGHAENYNRTYNSRFRPFYKL